MANYLTTDTDLEAVADAIRNKGGTSAPLSFPQGFVEAVEAIEAGGGGGVTAATGTVTLASKELVPGANQSKAFPGIELSFKPDIFVLTLDNTSWDAIATPSIGLYTVICFKRELLAPYRIASNVSTDSLADGYWSLISSGAIASPDVASNGYAVNGISTLGQEYQPLWYPGDDGKFYFGRFSSKANVGFEAGTYNYFAMKA